MNTTNFKRHRHARAALPKRQHRSIRIRSMLERMLVLTKTRVLIVVLHPCALVLLFEFLFRELTDVAFLYQGIKRDRRVSVQHGSHIEGAKLWQMPFHDKVGAETGEFVIFARAVHMAVQVKSSLMLIIPKRNRIVTQHDFASMIRDRLGIEAFQHVELFRICDIHKPCTIVIAHAEMLGSM